MQSSDRLNGLNIWGARITRKGLDKTEVSARIEQGRKIIGALNGIWWDKNIRPNTKVYIGRALVESVVTYGCEVWTLKAEQKRALNALEMDYLRRSAGVSKLDRVRNVEIRAKMDATQTIVDRVEQSGLKWFGTPKMALPYLQLVTSWKKGNEDGLEDPGMGPSEGQWRTVTWKRKMFLIVTGGG
ncbi:uncharacterized protein LOC115890512 [Sitophilus oryzae]|uniref:Uncharacterized protein LOC115890512 n=1 Tax=Sitophilus oryzae TaxID=7048 RepID=A0A6J2YUY7_SITOR|nr:uncharacterized protein LOC115890512 [Sitophilus oryzae]